MFKWWGQRTNKELSNICLTALSLPTTQVSVERTFSDLKYIINDVTLLMRLLPSIVNRCMYVLFGVLTHFDTCLLGVLTHYFQHFYALYSVFLIKMTWLHQKCVKKKKIADSRQKHVNLKGEKKEEVSHKETFSLIFSFLR